MGAGQWRYPRPWTRFNLRAALRGRCWSRPRRTLRCAPACSVAPLLLFGWTTATNYADSLDDVLDILRGRATGEYGNTHIDRAIEIAQLFTPLFVSTVSPVFDVLYSAAPEFECAAHLLYHVLVMADGHDLCVRKIRFVLVPTNVVAVPSPTDLIRDAISKNRRAPKRVLIQVDVAPVVVAGERRFRLKRAPDAPSRKCRRSFL